MDGMKEQFSKMDEENTGEKPVLSLKIKKYSQIKKSAENSAVNEAQRGQNLSLQTLGSTETVQQGHR